MAAYRLFVGAKSSLSRMTPSGHLNAVNLWITMLAMV